MQLLGSRGDINRQGSALRPGHLNRPQKDASPRAAVACTVALRSWSTVVKRCLGSGITVGVTTSHLPGRLLDLKMHGQSGLKMFLAGAARYGDVSYGNRSTVGGMPPLSRATSLGLRCCSSVAVACTTQDKKCGFHYFPPDRNGLFITARIKFRLLNHSSHHSGKPAPTGKRNRKLSLLGPATLATLPQRSVKQPRGRTLIPGLSRTQEDQ